VFQVGDLVLKRQHVLSSAAQNIAAKIAPKFHGPFRVNKILSSVVYELLDLHDNFAGKVVTVPLVYAYLARTYSCRFTSSVLHVHRSPVTLTC
jgi:hypothetical protein